MTSQSEGQDAVGQAGSNLSGRAAKGAGIVMIGQGVRIVVQVLGIVILARLLDAEDYGLVAMVTAIIGIAEIIRDFGLAPAAIQARTLSDAERSNLFWLNSGFGLFLSLAVASSSSAIAAAYGDHRVQGIVMMLAPIYFLNGMSAQFRANLSRNFKFVRLTSVEIVGQSFGLTAGVGSAMLGFGYWSIVAQQLTQAVVILLGVAIVGAWVPGWYNRSAPIKRFLTYGGGLLATQVLVYASSNVDSIIIGTRFGPVSLGFYNRAFQMLVLPLNQISSPATRVALPVLSRMHETRERFHNYLIGGQLALTWAVLPFYSILAFNAGSVVDVVLGQKWSPVAPLFTLLAVGGAFQTLSYVTHWIFLATGKTTSNLRFALCTRGAMIAALIFGSTFGTLGVASAYSSALAAIWLFGLIWIRRVAGAPSKQMFVRGASTLLLCVASGLASRLISDSFGLGPFASVLLAILAFVVVYAVLCIGLPMWRRDASVIFRILRLVVRRRP